MGYVTTGNETCAVCGKPAAGLVTRGRGKDPAGWCADHQREVIDAIRAGNEPAKLYSREYSARFLGWTGFPVEEDASEER